MDTSKLFVKTRSSVHAHNGYTYSGYVWLRGTFKVALLQMVVVV